MQMRAFLCFCELKLLARGLRRLAWEGEGKEAIKERCLYKVPPPFTL